MTRKFTDTIYKNADDTVRFSIYKEESGLWNARIFYYNMKTCNQYKKLAGEGQGSTFGLFMSDYWYRKKDVRNDLEKIFGKIVIVPGNKNIKNVTDGWN